MNPSLNSSEKKSGFSEKKEDNSEKNNTKGKEKKKEYIDIDTAPPDPYFSDDSLNKAFLLFLKTRRGEGAGITEEQVKLLKATPVSAKFGGATGNFNAHHVAYPDYDWKAFGNKFVNEVLGLSREEWTTQISNYDNIGCYF